MRMNRGPVRAGHALALDNPRSVAIYDDYDDAARAVDYLADHGFPVQNLAIVGTDLKSIENVTGQLTWGKVLLSGFVQAVSWAAMFALVMYMVNPGSNFFAIFLVAMLGFGLVGMAMAAVQYRMRGSERYYTSTGGIIATHYEILAEGQYANQAREFLGGSRAATHSQQLVDLGALPPPYGQTPIGEEPSAEARADVAPADPVSAGGKADGGADLGPGPGDQPQPTAPPQQIASTPLPAEPQADEPRWGDRPYGSLGNGDSGIGDLPMGWEAPGPDQKD